MPQKSWHVYRRDNVSKVEKDEKEARKVDEEAKKKHEDEERAYRRGLLLQRARGNASSSDGQSKHERMHGGEEAAVGSSGLDDKEKESGSLLQHINFWSEDEARMQEKHPEVERESLAEKRARGRESEQTTDAAFDKRFKLGHGFESAAQPWYARSTAVTAPAPPGVDEQGEEIEKKLEGKVRRRTERRSSSTSSSYSSDDSRSSDADQSQKRKRKHKHKQKKKKEKEKKEPRRKSIEELRAERLEREKIEHEREKQLLLGKRPMQETKGYNSSFGFADLIKRKK